MKKSRTITSAIDQLSPPAFHQILTSANQGIHIDSCKFGHLELPFKTTAAWSIKKWTLHGGKQEGVDIIEVDNGKLRIVIVPTRGMSVLKVESGDVRLGWDSPVTEVVHPNFINLQSRCGLGWLEGFNEWMVRCGLEWAGHPGRDKICNNLGDEVEMDLTLHGKIANIPASEVGVLIEPGLSPRLHVRGLVQERMFSGPKLSFWTDISTEVGSHSFRFDDSVTNQGNHEQEFQLIYHTNFGPPLLEAGARFLGAVSRVTPFDLHAAKSVKSYQKYIAPLHGFREQVYCLYPVPGPDGRTEILLQNAQKNRGVSMVFPVQQLPYLTLWKNLTAKADGYVTGIEPGTGFPYTRRLERQAGRVPKLAPNETRRFSIEVTIHSNQLGVQLARKRIQIIQRKTKTTIENVKRPLSKADYPS